MSDEEMFLRNRITQATDDIERNPNSSTIIAYQEAWDEYQNWLHNNSEEATEEDIIEAIADGVI